MGDNIVYGAGGIPMVKQEVAPVEKVAEPKKEKKQPLQEIYGDDGFDEEHGDNWVPYKSASAPLMLVRKNFTNFGIVSTTQTCLFGSIQERELIATGPNPIVVSPTLTTYEDSQINSETSETVNVGFKCKQRKKRDLITFDVIDLDPEQIDINEMISDDEIEIEEEVS